MADAIMLARYIYEAELFAATVCIRMNIGLKVIRREVVLKLNISDDRCDVIQRPSKFSP